MSVDAELYSTSTTMPMLSSPGQLGIKQSSLYPQDRLVIFMYIVLVHSFSALADNPNHAEWIVTTTYNMEYSLAVYFTAEFLVRLWAIGADAKHAGWKGFRRYMCRFISIIDVLILIVTFFVVCSYHSTFSITAIERIRFLQILRLLHIDRQMTTWKMIQKMISRSFEELVAVYSLSGLIFLLMAYSAYELEEWAESSAKAQNVTIVSVLTIGYGDIVPHYWLSKLVLSVLCICGVILFTAASALVGVGMSLMVENETKQQQQTKVRNLAATLIQTWYRFHLISNHNKFAAIPQFRKLCNDLHFIEERFRTTRSLIKQSVLRKASKRFSQPFKRQTSLSEQGSANENSNTSDLNTIVSFLNSAPVIGSFIADYDLNLSNRFKVMNANERSSLPSELPPRPPRYRNNSYQIRPIQIVNRVSRSHSALARSVILQNASSCGSPTTSIDFLDEETLLDCYYDPYESNSMGLNKQKSVDTTTSFLDDGAISRYRQILRMLYFFIFVITRKKFNRARKPYELLDAESELCEMEYQKMQRFKELELRIQATVGKTMLSPFQDDDIESSASERLNIEDRLILCEDALGRLENKARLINDLANSILASFQPPKRKSGKLLGPLMTLSEVKHSV